MKKIIFFLFLLSISCSKDESDNTSNPNQEQTITSFDVNITSTEGGTVNVSSGSYEEGAVLTITASASEGFVFSNWTGFDSTDNTITINVNQLYNLNAVFIPEEEASLDQNFFSDNVEIEGAQEYQGSPTPDSNISFTMENDDNVLAVVENGFNIDLNVPNNVEGAYLQFENEDGVSSDSFFLISRENSGKKTNKEKNKFFKNDSGNHKNIINKNINNSNFNIEVDFNQNITAGRICLNIYVYESNNVSYPIELCITINNFGGGPSEIHGQWEYYQTGYDDGEQLDDWNESGEEYPDGYYDGNEYVEVNDCYSPSCFLTACYNDDGDFQGYTRFSNVESRDYIVLNSDGSYEDRYTITISESPEIVGNVDSCLEDEYDGDLFRYSKDFYQTTINQVYYGKWSYDETTNTIGIYDYSDGTTDSGGTIFDTPVDTYDEPQDYFSNGTFVEINGDTMILKERNSYDNSVYVYVFKRIQ